MTPQFKEWRSARRFTEYLQSEVRGAPPKAGFIYPTGHYVVRYLMSAERPVYDYGTWVEGRVLVSDDLYPLERRMYPLITRLFSRDDGEAAGELLSDFLTARGASEVVPDQCSVITDEFAAWRSSRHLVPDMSREFEGAPPLPAYVYGTGHFILRYWLRALPPTYAYSFIVDGTIHYDTSVGRIERVLFDIKGDPLVPPMSNEDRIRLSSRERAMGEARGGDAV